MKNNGGQLCAVIRIAEAEILGSFYSSFCCCSLLSLEE